MTRAEKKRWRMCTDNVAAITSTFHESGFYEALYEGHGEKYGGFPGLWRFFADLGENFTDAETELKVTAGEDYEWIDAIDLLVKWVHDYHFLQAENSSSDWLAVCKRAIHYCTFSRSNHA